MDDRRGRLSDEMLLALAVWLCSLPLMAALFIPWLGWPAAVSVAVLLLLMTLMACWGACGWRAFVRSSRGQDKHDLG